MVVQHINDSAIELFRENEEAFGKVWRNFDPENMVGRCVDDFHQNPEHIRRLLADPINLPHISDISIGDRRINLAVGAVHDRDGQYVGATLEWTDVTTSRTHAGMISAMDRSQGIAEFDIDGTIRHTNDQFLETFGYRPDEIVGRHHRTLLPDETVGDDAALWRKLSAGEAQQGTFKRKSKAGDPRWVQATYTPIQDRSGRVFKVVCLSNDVTDHALEQQRQDAERRQREVEQGQVVEGLAKGLERLSAGEFDFQLENQFPEDYKRLQDDFNQAVLTLSIADEQKRRISNEQQEVVSALAQALQQLKAGNLQHRIETSFPSDYEQLRNDFNAAGKALAQAMVLIHRIAMSVNSGSTEIAQAADSLSTRTESQAATLEETAAALDQITQAVHHTAEGAVEANKTAAEMSANAERTGTTVEEAVSAMDRIATSAKAINQIISVIDDIAFQTNLLALNAGVEAARAGAAGRGFAVVAHEVRGLAQRSSEAAKEIKSLISESDRQVGDGVELVGKAGDALKAILANTTAVSGHVNEIAASAQEQSISLREVNTALNRMDEVTQENAGMVEESSAASHHLAKAASTLLENVGRFEIGTRLDGEAVPDYKEPVHAAANSVQQLITTQQDLALDDDAWSEF
ncbi:MAG: PAS domain-containing protein [Parvularculaceae bacterium]|nr:PAS domain-containing protein [Parvularculaceae bacterium]